MGWELGFDDNWRRDIGYGVPAWCDYPGCFAHINRGLGFVCGGDPYGGDAGCGLFFCEKHLGCDRLCLRCCASDPNKFQAKPDRATWMYWKLTHASWQGWRAVNLSAVAEIYTRLAEQCCQTCQHSEPPACTLPEAGTCDDYGLWTPNAATLEKWAQNAE